MTEAAKGHGAPDFIIVGAMRSGSTTLFRYLADHPGIFMPSVKEVHYFNHKYELGHEWYERLFEAARSDQRTGEATPSYLASPIAIERLARDLPNVRTISILRDPTERAYSHYWLRRSRGRETRAWDEVVAQDLSSDDPASVFWPSRYAVHLKRLDEAVGTEQTLTLALSDLESNPNKTVTSVCAYLGVPPRQIDAASSPHINAYFEVRSMRLRILCKSSWVPRRLRNAVAKVNQVEKEYPPMDARTRQLLDDAFAVDRSAMARVRTRRHRESRRADLGAAAMPRFSVIIPTFRRPTMLREAVASVLAQTQTDLEVIVVDDAGGEVGELPADPRVRVVERSVGGGPGAAINTGVGVARGDLLAFLDDDDWFDPRRLELAVRALDSAPLVVCWSRFHDSVAPRRATPRR